MHSHKLPSTLRLLVVLTWLRKYISIRELEDKFEESKFTIQREIAFICCLLVEVLDYCKFPSVKKLRIIRDSFEKVIGAIDGLF